MPYSATTHDARLGPHLYDIIELWEEMRGFGAHESDVAAKLCMERICGWLRAQDAFWVGLVRVVKRPGLIARDSLSGWRARAIYTLRPPCKNTFPTEPLLKLPGTASDPGATNIALTAGGGCFRAYSLHGGELVDFNAFLKTDYYDRYYRQRGIVDRIWVASPVSADAESVFCFDRTDDGACFDCFDLELAALALRGIKWFHHQLLLSHGLGLGEDALTPGERRVILELLAGAPEREIASRLNLTPGTVHQYATRIYRKFGVAGRIEFMALWLAQCT